MLEIPTGIVVASAALAVEDRPAGEEHETVTPTCRRNGPQLVERALARVLVVDAQPIVRHGIRALLAAESDLTLAAEAATPRDALRIATRVRPDVIVTEVEFGPQRSPRLDMVSALRRRHKSARILVFTSLRDRQATRSLLRLGIHGYLDKHLDSGQLVRGIRALSFGQAVFSLPPECSSAIRNQTAITRNASSVPSSSDVDPDFTNREQEVLGMLARGLSNKEIGVELGITEATVKFHLRNLQNKLNVRGRTRVLSMAIRNGFV